MVVERDVRAGQLRTQALDRAEPDGSRTKAVRAEPRLRLCPVPDIEGK